MDDQQARPQKQPRLERRSKIFAFYTHKGGVGKTTCLTHMAVKAAMQGKNVLVVDCDPQMNSTNFFFGYLDNHARDFNAFYDSLVNYHTAVMKPPMQRSDEEQNLVAQYQNRHENIWDLLREISPERGINQTFQDYPEIGIEVATPHPGKLWLVASHPMLGEIETYLAREVNDSYQLRDHSMRFVSLMRHLTNRENMKLDMILVDLSPSSSFLNQNILLSSDFIVLPCSADEYAYYSVRTIGMWLNAWTIRHAQLALNPHVLTVVYNKYKRQGNDRTEISVGQPPNSTIYHTSAAHAGYIRRLIGPLQNNEVSAIGSLVGQNPRFVVQGLDYLDIPLICDGLSTISKLSSMRRTAYDAFNNAYHQSDKDTCVQLRQEYDRLWRKIDFVLR